MAEDTVVDLGCGSGEDLRQFAEESPDVQFVGVDRSSDWVVQAKVRGCRSNVRFLVGDVSSGLPFRGSSIDAIYSVNLLECVADQKALISECARVLKPSGRLLVAHYDWDTQTFDGDDRSLVRRVVQAYNDWQQDWMPAIDPWCGRRLWRLFREEGSFVGEVTARTLIETGFGPESYGRQMAESFEALVPRGLLAAEDYASFIDNLHSREEQGTFFYSVTMYAYVGRKTEPRPGTASGAGTRS